MGNRWARLALGIWSVGLGACATAGAGNAPPAREATAAGPALPAHVERAHRRVLERCLALPVAGVDGATLEFPPSMLDGVDGTLTRRKKTLDDQVAAQNARISSIDIQLANRRTVLEAQFRRMETAIGQLQTQSSSLASIG